MPTILAMDAGGTSTRAAVLDANGRCLGFGRAETGNPTAAGIDSAVEQLGLAAERASAGTAESAQGGVATISLAGTVSESFIHGLRARLTPLGFGAPPNLQPDLLGTYTTGTIAPEGCAIVAGTGAVAGHVRDGRLELTRDGTGWLLGDTGSGFWIGRRVARAVVAHLDGIGPETALTEKLLTLCEIDGDLGGVRGRPGSLIRLMDVLYAWRPVDLARCAPLAFDSLDDPIARGILVEAADSLARLLTSVREQSAGGPVVLGGSILSAGMRSASDIFTPLLTAAAAGSRLIPVVDGVVGAAVLGLRHAGVEVDETVFARVQHGIARLRTNADAGGGTSPSDVV